jgi:hypothetical protein
VGAAVLSGGVTVARSQAACGTEGRRPSPAASLGLTLHEAEVLALAAEDRTNRQIGQTLFITPQDRQRPRLEDPRQVGPPVTGKLPRSPTGSASTSHDPPRLGNSSSRAGSMTSSLAELTQAL